jgi:hypothetical protein
LPVCDRKGENLALRLPKNGISAIPSLADDNN